MSYPYQEFDPAKIRTYIRSLEQDVANLQDRLISEEGKVIALTRRFDYVIKETKSRERKQGQTQIQALRYKLEKISLKELQQSQERWHRQFQAEIARQNHIHEGEMRKMKKNYEEKIHHLKSQLNRSKHAILQSQEEQQFKFLVLEQVCQCHQRPSSSSILSTQQRPWGNSGSISRSAVTINGDDDPLIHLDSCRYLQSSGGSGEVPSRSINDEYCCLQHENSRSNITFNAGQIRPSFIVSGPTEQPKSEPNLVRVGQELCRDGRNLSLRSILRPDLDPDSSDEEYFSMYSSLEYTPVRDLSVGGSGGVGSTSLIPRIRRHSSLRVAQESPESPSLNSFIPRPKRSNSVSRSSGNEVQTSDRRTNGNTDSGKGKPRREENRFFAHHKLRQSQSVDLYRAQLEEKDKTIAAMKQAAKERDWKFEKLKLNLQTFKSVGSLKDLGAISPFPNTPELGESDPNKRVCDYATYMKLLQENAQLQHLNRLLQSRMSEGLSEERQNLLHTELMVTEAKIKDLEAILNGQNVDLTLVEEKKQLQQLNLGLAERIAELQENESKLLGKLQDAKDQSELLEFRVLELEEDKIKGPSSSNNHDQMGHDDPPAQHGTHNHDTDQDDSGCNSSSTTDEDILELYQDFRGEKVADTKNQLQRLVSSLPKPNDKSLLLQTVALFETLLSKIHDLQAENETLKTRVEVESENRSTTNDQMILEMELSRKDLQIARQAVDELTQERHILQRDLNATKQDLERKESKNAQIQDARDKLEVDLRNQIATLQSKLNTTMVGRESESQMYEQAIMKANHLENTLKELDAKTKTLSMENAELKENLATVLENHTSKSVGSIGSEYSSSSHRKVPSVISDGGSDHPKTSNGTSSGVSSDLSDSDTDNHDEGHHHSRRKVSSSSSTRVMEESGIFDASTSTSPDLMGVSLTETATQTTEKSLNPPVVMKSPLLLRHASDYESCEELDDLREECRDLVTRKNSLEDEIEGFKSEIKTLKSKMEDASTGSDDKITRLEQVEYSLRNQLKEWEKKYRELHKQNQNLLEEKCELEEAENDSRLNAQRWEHQYRLTYDRNEQLSQELQIERNNVLMVRDDLSESQSKELEIRNDVAYLEALVQRYEQRIFDLEEVEVELREKLILLEKACYVVAWFRSAIKINKSPLPILMEIHDSETQTSLVEDSPAQDPRMDELEAYIRNLERDKSMLEDSLMSMMAEKDSIARSLEGTHEDRIERILQLEDRINDLNQAAREANEAHIQEITTLTNQLQNSETALKEKMSQSVQKSEAMENSLYSQDLAAVDLLQSELAALKEKEMAYCQTIQEADAILAKVQTNYEKTIQALEEDKVNLLEKIRVMETNEQLHKKDLKDITQNFSGGSETQKMAQLLERLMDSERTVIELKEVIFRLERSEREISLKILAEQKNNATFKNELHDQEALVAKLYQIEKDNTELNEEIIRLKEIERRFQDRQLSEGLLNCREQELEERESSLQSEICDLDRSTMERDKAWRERVTSLTHELQLHKETTDQLKEEVEKQNVYRVQVEGLSHQVNDMKETLASQTLALESNEATYRSENASLGSYPNWIRVLSSLPTIPNDHIAVLTKLRNQLSFSTSQLRDLDALNSTLQDEIRSLKASLSVRESEVRQLWQREERNLIDTNAKLRVKDEEIENLRQELARWTTENQSQENELQHMLNYEGGLISIRRNLDLVVQNIKSDPIDSVLARLCDISEQLQTLSYVICSQPNPSDPTYDLFRCESEESIQTQFMPSNGEPTLGKEQLAFFNNGSDYSLKNGLDGPDFGLPSLESNTSSCTYHSSASTLVPTKADEIQMRCIRLEEELTLANQECSEMQRKLEDQEMRLETKNQEVVDLTAVVEHLRQLNIRITEQHERHKVRFESINSRMKETQSSYDQLDHKCANKDFLIRTLADLMKTATDLRSTSIVRYLREATFKPSYVRGLDFNMESLCRFIESGNVSKEQRKSEQLSTIAQEYKESNSLDSTIAPWMIETAKIKDNLHHSKPEKSGRVEIKSHSKANGPLTEPEMVRVTRRVGADSLLLAWHPPKDTRVLGYMIFVNSEVRQKVRSASRTKALLHGLALDSTFTIGIESLGPEESASKRVDIKFEPDLLKTIAKRKTPPPTPMKPHVERLLPLPVAIKNVPQ